MKLKQPTGWFAATHQMRQALDLLSDGAFKLFVFLSLTADRHTGCLHATQTALARALVKSRTSISAYLEELSAKGVCILKPAANQHQPGEIEIADAFWPYEKEIAGHSETAYLEQISGWLAPHPIMRSSLAAAERHLLTEMFRKGVSLEQLERALLLGLTRKYVACLNGTATTPIYSFSYFLPLLEEVAQTKTPDSYWEYLRRRLRDLSATWQQQSRSAARGSTGSNSTSTTQSPPAIDSSSADAPAG
ncbi:MAG TPA: hypothetical protein VMM84_15565 [Pyrinomonadaceae bacterium]|nr:hypothetical protein [Pyrinomonadaceae bacterium]